MNGDIILHTTITALSMLKSETDNMRNGALGDLPEDMVDEISERVDDLREVVFAWRQKINKESVS